ncbi:uncharacterized protein LOC136089905 [Hydra vulgaris]|uniref:Uncharacterized protein LOC136089905 n=1 Tax=Hydra vulgaris TaxID=6087 RepID=A0ABM4DCE2_HYDVU
MNVTKSEQFWGLIKYGNETIKLGCIYRPLLKTKIIYNDEKLNNTNIERSNQAGDEIIQSIQAAKIELNRKIYTGILICGDFNFPYIKWYEDGSVQVNAFDTKNPKRLFSYANSSRKIKQSIKSIRNKYGVTGTDGRFIADTLNDQFKSVFNNNSVNKDSPLISNRTTERLSSLHFSIDEIKNKLKNLNPNKTTRPDNVLPMILKQCHNVLSLPLTIIYNKSLSERTIPHPWRNANVTPLFKKGDTNEPSNYRPVFLTSIPCKLMESLVTNDIVNHLSKLDLISQSQHGFVKNKACVTNLLESNDYITECIANKNAVDVVYLDFSKAFDTISHNLLIIKLKTYGIVGDLLDWIKDFLTNRKQRVVLGEHISGLTKLYADDSKLMNELRVKNILNDTTDIQTDLNKITERTKVYLMKLNLEKCKVMHMGNNNPRSNYSLQDTTNYLNYDLEKSDVEKDLGIFVSSNAKYFNQVIHASNKANRMLNMLKKTFISRDLMLWTKLYKTYVRPNLEHAISAWSPYLMKDIKTIEKNQRRSTKVPTICKHLCYTDRCILFQIQKLKDRRIRGDLIQKFKIEKGLTIIIWHNEPITRPARCGQREQFVREFNRNSDPRYYFFN